MALLTVRMSDEEYGEVRDLATRSGLSLSDVVRAGLEALDTFPRRDAAAPATTVPEAEGHEHRAEYRISGAIAVCACGARRTLGSRGTWHVPGSLK